MNPQSTECPVDGVAWHWGSQHWLPAYFNKNFWVLSPECNGTGPRHQLPLEATHVIHSNTYSELRTVQEGGKGKYSKN